MAQCYGLSRPLRVSSAIRGRESAGESFFVGRGDRHVFFGERLDPESLLRRDGPDDLGGDADHEAAGGDLRALGDQRPGADDAAGPNDGAIQNSRTHSDEALVFYRAGMYHGTMSDRDARTDDAGEIVGEVHDRTILHVGGGADFDAVDVAAQDDAEPDARFGSYGDVAADVGGRGDERRRVDLRAGAEVAGESLLEIHANFSRWRQW